MEIYILAFGVTACASVLTGQSGPRACFYLWKPLALVWLVAASGVALYRAPGLDWRLIGLGLALLASLAGDVLLMLPKDRFVLGLASFALAHVAYIAVFSVGRATWGEPWVLLAVAVYGAGIVFRLWPFLGRLRVPVIVYALLIMGMLDQAWVSFLRAPMLQTAVIALGATVFVVSDSILAWNRFVRPVAFAQSLILSTYYIAQGLIVGALLLSH